MTRAVRGPGKSQGSRLKGKAACFHKEQLHQRSHILLRRQKVPVGSRGTRQIPGEASTHVFEAQLLGTTCSSGSRSDSRQQDSPGKGCSVPAFCPCHRPLSKDTRPEVPVLRPSMALGLFSLIRRMNEMFPTPAQFGTDARETLTSSKTNCVQHLGTRHGGQEEVADGELGGFK